MCRRLLGNSRGGGAECMEAGRGRWHLSWSVFLETPLGCWWHTPKACFFFSQVLCFYMCEHDELSPSSLSLSSSSPPAACSRLRGCAVPMPAALPSYCQVLLLLLFLALQLRRQQQHGCLLSTTPPHHPSLEFSHPGTSNHLYLFLILYVLTSIWPFSSRQCWEKKGPASASNSTSARVSSCFLIHHSRVSCLGVETELCKTIRIYIEKPRV